MNNHLKLLNMAQQAAANAYAPYSNFKVGAAISSSNGNLYSGCNVENISYPIGTCAEEAAIASMITNGDYHISQILIYADSTNLITPCGACRQRIYEFADKQCQIILANNEGIQKIYTINDLLPQCFKDF